MTSVRCPILVGRGREQRALADLVGRAAGGNGGSWVTVTGEAGVGESRLVAEAASAVSTRGRVVAVGRCSLADRRTPFRPLAEMLLSALRDSPPPVSPRLRPHVPAVARFAPHWRTDGPESWHRPTSRQHRPKEKFHAHRRRVRVPADDVAKYHLLFEVGGAAVLEQPKRLSHVCYRTEGGFTVVDVWEDEASFAGVR